MLALPLKLEGCQILDADDRWIGLIRGEMKEYRKRGAEIVAAVNSSADLLAAAKRTIAQYEGIYDEGSQEIYMQELRAAIARAEQG